jgi:hypothetical protein
LDVWKVILDVTHPSQHPQMRVWIGAGDGGGVGLLIHTTCGALELPGSIVLF